jgi:hypothetical protein
MATPSNAQSTPIVNASPRMNIATCFGRKPTARKTPYSFVRSRTAMAIVLPRISIMMHEDDGAHQIEGR